MFLSFNLNQYRIVTLLLFQNCHSDNSLVHQNLGLRILSKIFCSISGFCPSYCPSYCPSKYYFGSRRSSMSISGSFNQPSCLILSCCYRSLSDLSFQSPMTSKESLSNTMDSKISRLKNSTQTMQCLESNASTGMCYENVDLCENNNNFVIENGYFLNTNHIQERMLEDCTVDISFL